MGPGDHSQGTRKPSAAGTAWPIASLAAGLLAGGLFRALAAPGSVRLAAFLAPIGQLWVAAIQVTVLPLVITQALAASARRRGEGSIGNLAAKTLALFVIMLLAAGIFAMAISPALVSWYPADARTDKDFRTVTASPEPAQPRPVQSIEKWIGSLLPNNIFQALSGDEILPALLFAILLGFAVARLPREHQEPLQNLFQVLADATMILVSVILKLAPVGVFALGFVLAVKTGIRAAAFVGSYVVIVCTALLLATALLYPITSLLARVSIRRFARAAAPAQIVAVSTRSSLASLPALVEGGREHLQLPAETTSFVLPLSVSVFKIDRTISCVAELLLLAKVFHVRLGLAELITFLLTILLLSFGAGGIPDNGGASHTLAAYLAAGIPMQGPLILRSVVAIPDIFQTLINVTGDMSAATILSRSARREQKT